MVGRFHLLFYQQNRQLRSWLAQLLICLDACGQGAVGNGTETFEEDPRGNVTSVQWSGADL